MKPLLAHASRKWPEHYTPIIGVGQVEYMLGRFQSAAAIKAAICDGYTYYLLTEGCDPIGYLAVQPRGEELFLSKIYVEAQWRRQGYGQSAIGFVEKPARERGLRRSTLTVNRKNLTAIAAYERGGFQKTVEIVQDIGCGFVMDDYRMEKIVL